MVVGGWPVGTVVSMGPLHVRVEGAVGSTHDELWARRRWVEPGTGMAAAWQSAGVGRAGTRWQSPPGGLYVSVVAGAGMPAGDLDALGEAACIAVLDLASEACPGGEFFLKWPNDAFVRMPRHRVGKFAGVVVRAESGADEVMRAVVSVGVNLEAALESVDAGPGPMLPASLEGDEVRRGGSWSVTRLQALEWLVGFMAVHLERARVDPGAVRARYGEELRRAPLRARVAGVREKFRPVGVARGGALMVRRESGRAAEVSVEDAERLEWVWPREPPRKRGRAVRKRKEAAGKSAKPSPKKRRPKAKAKGRAPTKRKVTRSGGRPARAAGRGGRR